MKLEQALQYLRDNKPMLNYVGIAKQLKIDISNFHKMVNGTLPMKEEKQKELFTIIDALCHKAKPKPKPPQQ